MRLESAVLATSFLSQKVMAASAIARQAPGSRAI